MAPRILDAQRLISDFVPVHAYLLQLTLALGYFGFMIAGMQKGRAPLLEIQSFLEKHAPVRWEADATPEAPVARAIGLQFSKVSAEPNGIRVLADVSMQIPAGQVTGVVGASGHGKSSLLKIMTRQLTVTDGHVYFNEWALEELSPATLTGLVSVLPQDIRAFRGTILENLTYGHRKTLVPRQLEEVLEAPNLSAVIKKLPQGLETFISNEETVLSKGEMQRITLARCLLKKRRFIYWMSPLPHWTSRTKKKS